MAPVFFSLRQAAVALLLAHSVMGTDQPGAEAPAASRLRPLRPSAGPHGGHERYRRSSGVVRCSPTARRRELVGRGSVKSRGGIKLRGCTELRGGVKLDGSVELGSSCVELRRRSIELGGGNAVIGGGGVSPSPSVPTLPVSPGSPSEGRRRCPSGRRRSFSRGGRRGCSRGGRARR